MGIVVKPDPFMALALAQRTARIELRKINRVFHGEAFETDSEAYRRTVLQRAHQIILETYGEARGRELADAAIMLHVD